MNAKPLKDQEKTSSNGTSLHSLDRITGEKYTIAKKTKIGRKKGEN